MSAVLTPKPTVSPAEWALRVQLAGAYRVADHLGWAELIYTHISARVPGPEHHFLINPYGLRFDEVTASSLVKVNQHGETVGPQTYSANKAGFIIHSAIHMAREDAQCVWHMHTLPGMAVSAQEDGLRPLRALPAFCRRLPSPIARCRGRGRRRPGRLGDHSKLFGTPDKGPLADHRQIPQHTEPSLST